MTARIELTRIPDVVRLARSVGIKPLLLGPPGIGKTTMVAHSAALLAREGGKILVALSREAVEAARMTGVNVIAPSGTEELLKVYDDVRREPDKYLVYLRIVATQVTPEDLQYPRLYNGSVVNVAPVKLAMLTIPGVEGILFIDEITNVQRDDTLTMFFAMVQEGQVGLAGQLSDRVTIVAAGNPPSVSSAAAELPAPLVNRFAVYNVEPPSAREVASYILAKHGGRAHEGVVAYLVSTEKVYEQPPGEATLENYPTPRTWETAAVAAREAERIGDDVLRATLEALLGPRVGPEVYAFVKVKPPKLEELLENPSMFKSLEHEQKLLSVVMLASRLAERRLEGEELAKTARLVETVIEDESELFMLMKSVAGNSHIAKTNLARIASRLVTKERARHIITRIGERVEVEI